MDGRGARRLILRKFKKKDLTAPKADRRAEPKGEKKFQSIFSSSYQGERDSKPLFLPPEAFGNASSMDPDFDGDPETSFANSWDLATRYHEFKTRPSKQHLARQLRKLSAQAILERAQAVLGSVVHPMESRLSPWDELGEYQFHADLDVEETLENSPMAVASAGSSSSLNYPLLAQDVWMSYSVPRRQPLVVTVDTSLSMTGEKLALTAVAIAVVLLQFPEDPIGIVAFENEAKILKRPDERISVQDLVERFLDVPAQGYTHLEDGLKAALQLVRAGGFGGQSRPPSTVLLTDGKYTAGRDPAYLANRFPHLVVLKMGKERASLELCRELARKGSGALREVEELESLPSVMYGVVKDLLRGRSLS